MHPLNETGEVDSTSKIPFQKKSKISWPAIALEHLSSPRSTFESLRLVASEGTIVVYECENK